MCCFVGRFDNVEILRGREGCLFVSVMTSDFYVVLCACFVRDQRREGSEGLVELVS